MRFYATNFQLSAVIMKNLVIALTPGQHCKRCPTGGIAVARFLNITAVMYRELKIKVTFYTSLYFLDDFHNLFF